MKTRREVHSLDFILCILVSLLEQVFHGHGKPWKAWYGLDIELLDHTKFPDGQSSYEEVRVRIRPVGWGQEESIFVRCSSLGGSIWHPFEGTIRSPRLPDEFLHGFDFKVNVKAAPGLFILTLDGRGSSREEHFLKRAHPGWFEQQPV